MKVTFWAYDLEHNDEHGSAGLYAGFCVSRDRTNGTCLCHHDCVVLDVVEMRTWNEAKRHGNFLGDFGPEDGIEDPDADLETGECIP